MPKPNYAFEKRQRELAKKRKQDEKEARKRDSRAEETAQAAAAPAPAAQADAGSTPAAPRIHRRPGGDAAAQQDVDTGAGQAVIGSAGRTGRSA